MSREEARPRMISAAQLGNLVEEARSGKTDLQEVYHALEQFNESIRVSWIDEPDATPAYFEALNMCMELDARRKEISNIAARTTSCLVRRVVSQDREDDLVRSAPVVLPILVDSLSTTESETLQKDLEQGIEAMWLVCAEPTEQALREVGLTNRNASVRCATLYLLGDRLGKFSFRRFTPFVCRLLLDPDATTHNAAYALLVHFFSGAGDKARADLQRYLERLQIPDAIASRLLSKINYRVSPEPNSPPPGIVEHPPASSSTSSAKTEASCSGMSLKDLPILNDPKFSPQEGLTPLPCSDDDALLAMVDSMSRVFEGKENEQNWNQREGALKKLRQLMRVPDLSGHAWRKVMHRLQPGICKTLLSLRTTLSMTACHTVKEAFQFYGPYLDVLAETYVTDLAKVCASPKKITSQFAYVCISAILLNVTFQIKLLQFICRAGVDSKAQVRPYAMNWLKLISIVHLKPLQSCLTKPLVVEVEKCLIRGLTDASPETRVAGRGAFWAFSPICQQLTDKVFPKLDAATKKAVLSAAPKFRVPTHASPAPKLRTPTPPAGSSATSTIPQEDLRQQEHPATPSHFPLYASSTRAKNADSKLNDNLTRASPQISNSRESSTPPRDASDKRESSTIPLGNSQRESSKISPRGSSGQRKSSSKLPSPSALSKNSSPSPMSGRDLPKQEPFESLLDEAQTHVHVYRDLDSLSHVAIHRALTSSEDSELQANLVRRENIGRSLRLSSPGILCRAIACASLSDDEKKCSLEELMCELSETPCGAEVALVILEELGTRARLQPAHVKSLGRLLHLLPSFTPSRKILELTESLRGNKDVQEWITDLQRKAQDFPDISKVQISPSAPTPGIDGNLTSSDWDSRPTSSVFSWSADQPTSDNAQVVNSVGQIPTNQVDCLVFFEGLVKSVERRTASDKNLALLAMLVGGRRVIPAGGGGNMALALNTWSRTSVFQHRLMNSIFEFALDPVIDDAKVAVALVVTIELALCDAFVGREEELVNSLAEICEQRAESLLLRCKLIPEVVQAITATADAEALAWAAVRVLPNASLYSSKVMLERLLSKLVPTLSSDVVAAIARTIPGQMDDGDARVRKEAYPLLMAVFRRNEKEADSVQESLTEGQRRLVQYYLQC